MINTVLCYVAHSYYVQMHLKTQTDEMNLTPHLHCTSLMV